MISKIFLLFQNHRRVSVIICFLSVLSAGWFPADKEIDKLLI